MLENTTVAPCSAGRSDLSVGRDMGVRKLNGTAPLLAHSQGCGKMEKYSQRRDKAARKNSKNATTDSKKPKEGV
jgi:hypothetical protein